MAEKNERQKKYEQETKWAAKEKSTGGKSERQRKGAGDKIMIKKREKRHLSLTKKKRRNTCLFKSAVVLGVFVFKTTTFFSRCSSY